MVYFLMGASHTGKTLMALRLLARMHVPAFSLDHLKMGLLRTGMLPYSVEEDEAIERDMWPIVRELCKTVLENQQDLLLEGCYIPFSWRQDFSPAEASKIRAACLVMTESYIRRHFADILSHANAVENRKEDSFCSMKEFLAENTRNARLCRAHAIPIVEITEAYDIEKIEEKLELLFTSPHF